MIQTGDAASVEFIQTLGAIEQTVPVSGSPDVAEVAVGVEAGFPVLLARVGRGLLGWAFVVFLDVGQVEQEQAQLAGGGDGAAVLVGFGLDLAEQVDLVGEAVGGDGAEDVVAVQAEVAQIGVSGGAGAAHAVGDLLQGEVLALEVVGCEDASAASWGRWVGAG